MTTTDEVFELPDLSEIKDWDEMTPEEQAEAEAIEVATQAEEADDWLTEEFGELSPAPKAQITAAQKTYIKKHRMMTVPQLAALPPVRWFVEGVAPAAPRTVVYGAGGSRKSFLVLDWVVCASEGLDWQGREVRPGKVLYILGEGASGTFKRLQAWGVGRHVDPLTLTNIDFMATPVNFWALKPEQVANWAALLEELEYDYIVVDTLHTAMAGGEESSAKDIGIVYANATAVAGEAALVFVHHDTKFGNSGGRGSSSIRDDADVVLQMEDIDDMPHTSRLMADKLRDADAFPPMYVQHEVWVPEGGDPLDGSLYISGTLEAPPKGERVTRSAADKLLDWLDLHGQDANKLGWSGIRRYADENGYGALAKDTVTQAVRIVREGTIGYEDD